MKNACVWLSTALLLLWNSQGSAKSVESSSNENDNLEKLFSVHRQTRKVNSNIPDNSADQNDDDLVDLRRFYNCTKQIIRNAADARFPMSGIHPDADIGFGILFSGTKENSLVKHAPKGAVNLKGTNRNTYFSASSGRLEVAPNRNNYQKIASNPYQNKLSEENDDDIMDNRNYRRSYGNADTR